MNNGSYYFKLLLVYSLLVTAMTLLLAWRVQSQNETIAELVAPRSLRVGDKAPELTSTTSDGKPVSLRYGPAEKPKLVYILRSTCPYCAKMMHRWQRLSYLGQRQGLEVLGIVTDGLDGAKKVASEYHLDFALTIFPDHETETRFVVRHVPQTLLIDGDGIVRVSKVGLFDQAVEDNLLTQVQSNEGE